MTRFKGDYYVSRGVWERGEGNVWEDRPSERLDSRSKQLVPTTLCAPMGFEYPAEWTFGNADWGISLQVWRPAEKALRLPLLVSILLTDGLAYDVVCEELSDAIALINSMLPMIHEQQWRSEEEDKQEHYGYQGHVVNSEFVSHCAWCVRSRERWREHEDHS